MFQRRASMPRKGIVTNSPVAGKSSMDGFSLNGLTVKEAIAATKKFVTEKGIGRVKVNYRLRDAIFSRQRYWGEPFPVYYRTECHRWFLRSACHSNCQRLRPTSLQKLASHHWAEPRSGLGMLRRKRWLTRAS